MGLVNGARKLYRDSRLGFAADAAVTLLALGVVEWIGTLDFSTLPTFFATIAALVAGKVAGLITAWAAKRGPVDAAGPS